VKIPSYSVLLLDPWVRASLAACRALGRTADFEVGVGGYDSRRLAAGPAASSRYATRFHVLPEPRGPGGAFEEALARLVANYGYDVVLATDDITLARLASVDVPVPTFPDVGKAFQSLTDKAALADVCAQIGVAYPETRAPSNEPQTALAANELKLPVVVKSSRSAEAGPDAVRGAKGARVCWAVNDAVKAAQDIRRVGLQPILQARIRFKEKLNAVVIRSKRASEFRYAHLVLREAPPSGGIGVAVETLSAEAGVGAEAVDLLERLCDATCYEGLAQAEFYRSADDGQLYLVDVNPRLWGSTSFAERLGQRVVERGVRFALGLAPLGPAEYPLGKRFHTPFGEMRWLQGQRSKSAGLAELIRTTRPRDTFEYFDGRDLLPLGVTALQSNLRDPSRRRSRHPGRIQRGVLGGAPSARWCREW
jgi:ATP-grasp domain